jgi:hypothetical protein
MARSDKSPNRRSFPGTNVGSPGMVRDGARLAAPKDREAAHLIPGDDSEPDGSSRNCTRRCDVERTMSEGQIKGYVRAEGLNILATEATLDKTKPLTGFLDILTEDGRMRLAITGGAAADLMIDLKNFLALEQ